MGKGQEVLINGAFASVRVDRDRERKGEEGRKGREGKKSGVGAVMQAFEVWQPRE